MFCITTKGVVVRWATPERNLGCLKAFRPSFFSLQAVSGFACSVASLSRNQDNILSQKWHLKASTSSASLYKHKPNKQLADWAYLEQYLHVKNGLHRKSKRTQDQTQTNLNPRPRPTPRPGRDEKKTRPRCLTNKMGAYLTVQSACSVAVSYKPPMLVTRARLPACTFAAVYIVLTLDTHWMSRVS